MLQNIYLMNSDFNDKEEINYAMLLKLISEIEQANKQKDKV